MNSLRILVLAPDANPDFVSIALEGYSHSRALAQLHSVTIAIRSCNEEAMRLAGAPYRDIIGIEMPWLDRIYWWSLRWIFRDDYHSRFLTPFLYPFSIAFEWHVWRRLRPQLIGGEFDVVFRLTPTNPVLPSPFPFFLRKWPVPFVIGPINGGLPWPRGFSQAKKQKSWIDNLRNVYRLMPFARSTYRRAAAIIAGSSQTYAEFVNYGDKLFFVPENGVNASLCSKDLRCPDLNGKVEMIFLGALVPFKACDLALRAAAPLLREGRAHFTVVGDGPERGRIEQLAIDFGIEGSVSFCGMLSHAEAMQRLRSADVMVYPSVREFGGAVVVEALAAGAVPCVADFGGPGDIVKPSVGYKVNLSNESDLVAQLERALRELVDNRGLLIRLRIEGMSYARESLTWDAKARTVTEVLEWVLGLGPKPDLPPPRHLGIDPQAIGNGHSRKQEAELLGGNVSGS